jgi:hypothetical protein
MVLAASLAKEKSEKVCLRKSREGREDGVPADDFD